MFAAPIGCGIDGVYLALIILTAGAAVLLLLREAAEFKAESELLLGKYRELLAEARRAREKARQQAEIQAEGSQSSKS